MTKDLRERVARAICVADGENPDSLPVPFPASRLNFVPSEHPLWKNYLELADAAVAECAKWEPIETAPKDGTPILGFDLGMSKWPRFSGIMVISWDAENNEWCSGKDYDGNSIARFDNPTHWRPLPAPPTDE